MNTKELSEYYIENVKKNEFIEREIKEREKFVKEYPLKRILDFSKEEYCLGLKDSKNTFCYKLEFGEYKKTGFGIGGATAGKFGFYCVGKGKYKGKNNKIIKDADKYWEEFKKQLYGFLKEMEKSEPDFVLDEKYPLLGGVGNYMFLTKLLSLYYPEKYISMSKQEMYKKLGEYFNENLDKNPIANSYYANKIFRKKIPEANKYDGFYISNAIWKFFKKTEPEVTEKNGEKENDNEIVDCGTNEIYYGGPGCGKSKLVENKYCKNNNFVRTTFYPEYTNSDFIGQLVPFYNKEKEKLEYRIKPGYFTRAYEKALKNPNKNIYLIIEEINRGNAAAIFGDVFQLLDRVTNISKEMKNYKKIGESEYEISNNIIEDYILDSCGDNLNGSIKIPANLSIIATMNTSDQNVYTLDSAFKRRWKMIHVSNSFENTEYDLKIGSKYVPMLNCNITWKEFVNRINKAIININTFGINSEDKQIGKYFVDLEDLIDEKELEDLKEENNVSVKETSKKFAEKVLMYLWEDIAKLEPTEWFNNDIKTFDILLNNYQKNGIKVFSENIQKIIKPDEDGNEDE